MTDWKMPEWMREIWKGTGWHKHSIDISTAEKWRSECQFHQTPNLESQLLGAILVMENLHSHNFLSTPSERDEQEERVIRWGKERTAMMKEVTKQEKRTEELGTENAKLKKKIQDVTHAGKCASIGELNAGIEIEDLKIENEELKAEVDSLKEEIISGR